MRKTFLSNTFFKLGKGLLLLRKELKGLGCFSTSQLSQSFQILWRGHWVQVGVTFSAVSLAGPHQVTSKWVVKFPLATTGFGGSHAEAALDLWELTSPPTCLQGVSTAYARREQITSLLFARKVCLILTYFNPSIYISALIMDQPAKGAHGSLQSCQVSTREAWAWGCPRQKGALQSALFKVEAFKTVLHIHHPQREVFGCPPWREGNVQQWDPQQLPAKNNPEEPWINKIHFASPNITWLSSCSPSNVAIPFQPFLVLVFLMGCSLPVSSFKP